MWTSRKSQNRGSREDSTSGHHQDFVWWIHDVIVENNFVRIKSNNRNNSADLFSELIESETVCFF